MRTFLPSKGPPAPTSPHPGGRGKSPAGRRDGEEARGWGGEMRLPRLRAPGEELARSSHSRGAEAGRSRTACAHSGREGRDLGARAPAGSPRAGAAAGARRGLQVPACPAALTRPPLPLKGSGSLSRRVAAAFALAPRLGGREWRARRLAGSRAGSGSVEGRSSASPPGSGLPFRGVRAPGLPASATPRPRCRGMDRAALRAAAMGEKKEGGGGGDAAAADGGAGAAASRALQQCGQLQKLIDISIGSLRGLRTKCAVSNDLTQQEIRTLEVRGRGAGETGARAGSEEAGVGGPGSAPAPPSLLQVTPSPVASLSPVTSFASAGGPGTSPSPWAGFGGRGVVGPRREAGGARRRDERRTDMPCRPPPPPPHFQLARLQDSFSH